ncbi:hypothetical protein CF319_g6775 [Tilletia indica]|nr:hypothetical protein CF319_g6775 [Tilletia indica]
MYSNFGEHVKAQAVVSDDSYNEKLFFHRIARHPGNRDKYEGSSAHGHAHIWGTILHDKALSQHGSELKAEGRNRNKERVTTGADVQLVHPGKTAIQRTLNVALARVYTVHASAHRHRIRVLLHALEMTFIRAGVALYPEGIDGFEFSEEMELHWIMRGYFGEYCTVVPTMNFTTRSDSKGRRLFTLRFRDRPLPAASLPALVPLGGVPFDERLRAMDATEIRLWEPQADEKLRQIIVHFKEISLALVPLLLIDNGRNSGKAKVLWCQSTILACNGKPPTPDHAKRMALILYKASFMDQLTRTRVLAGAGCIFFRPLNRVERERKKSP